MISRRNFLRTSAATASGLWISFSLPSKAAATSNKLNAFVHVGTDDSVTLFIHKAEMGQGTVTSLSQLLAEELECDWKKVGTEFPGVSREYGGMQGVFGSASIRTSYDSLRRAGAAAREMLVQAARSSGASRPPHAAPKTTASSTPPPTLVYPMAHSRKPHPSCRCPPARR
jgi:isoquinoline 1-oxidoreductase beta subunit